MNLNFSIRPARPFSDYSSRPNQVADCQLPVFLYVHLLYVLDIRDLQSDRFIQVHI